MLTSLTNIIILIITCLFILILFNFCLKSKKHSDIRRSFSINCLLMIIWLVGLILQATLSNILNISPIYFDYFVYIGLCLIPVSFYNFSKVFSNTKYKLNKLLLIVPILSLLILWTNDFHHLFYKNYSININEAVYGLYFYIHSAYSYLLFGLSFIELIRYSIKNAGIFSKQALLFLLGSLIPILANVFAFSGIIQANIYLTPICFALTVILFAFAIFKFNFLSIAPIALQRIVDRISDSYVVVNEDNVIIDFNETFLKTFKVSANDVRNKELFELFKKHDNFNMVANKLIKDTDDIKTLEKYFDKIDKYFHIEITRIESKGNFLGTLILFKDITQHTIDMQTIRDNQDMLVEKERLASLGQMIGGIAHNLKTPIMSIAGAAEGLSDLIKEYDASVGDPEVTIEDHHEIAKDMQEWIEKTKTHLSYMSDVITAIKGQAVAFSEQTASGFTIKELINYIDILMKHELKNGLTNLNTKADIDTSTVVKGNINSLVQVINNIISNAIQAYQEKGKSNQDINFTIYKDGNNIVFKIEDFAGGLPKKVQDKLFKEMITTKGKNGTGLGLFMSYSNIKAHFSGSMDYETEKGKGTTFYISIPV